MARFRCAYGQIVDLVSESVGLKDIPKAQLELANAFVQVGQVHQVAHKPQKVLLQVKFHWERYGTGAEISLKGRSAERVARRQRAAGS